MEIELSHILKTLQITIIGVGVVASLVFLVIISFVLEATPHTEMTVIGLNGVYDVYQTIRFKIHAAGYGNGCVGTPEITIYETDHPSNVVYHEKSMLFMCPEELQMSSFSGDYPSQNDYYITAIDEEGKYTLHVSYRNTEIEMEFMVKAK